MSQSEIDALKACSVRIGNDPLLIQGPGGNTSVKLGDTMWIKASGTLLRDALTAETLVPTRWKAIRDAVADDPARADRPYEFQIEGTLRPSIETSLHAVLPQAVVIHVHCVDTIAIAMQRNAPEIAAAMVPNPVRLASGPDWPMRQLDATTRSGLRARSASWPKPIR